MVGAWCNLLIRSGIILIVAEGLRRSSHRWAARDRHRMIGVAFALVLVWPLLSALLPEVALPLQTYWPTDGTVTIQQTISSLGSDLRQSMSVSWPLAIWLGGIVLTLAPVIASHLRVRRLAKGAACLEDEGWQDSLARECSRLRIKTIPKLLIDAGPMVPFTFGLWHPRIVLPAGCLEWTPERRRAVLLHELAHIQRWDVAWQLLANIVTAIWWFQPLCWWSRRNLRRESEQACDALVVDSGLLASEYARELLEIAKDLRNGREWSYGAIAMVRQGELEGRLHAILRPRFVQARKLPMAALAVLTMLAFAASALTIFPEQSSLPGGENMKHTLLSSLLVSAGLSAATVSGAIATPNEAASSPAPVAAANGSADHTQEQQQVPPKKVRIGGNIAQKNLETKVNPRYPPSAKAAGIQGTVVLDATITTEGVPVDLRVVSSPSNDLTQASIDAVRQWRYRPTLLNGEPVEVETTININFTLSK